VSILLRAIAVLSLAWAVLFLCFKERFAATGEMPSLMRALANGLGVANLVLAFVFWQAAGDPAANRGVVYGAIMLSALKTANDLYDLLVLLPPDRALVSLGDLVLSVALLVGILEALPKTLPRRRSGH
jgi:hypothetical protein